MSKTNKTHECFSKAGCGGSCVWMRNTVLKLIVAVFLVAASSKMTHADGVLRVSVIGFPSSLDPVRSTTSWASFLVRQRFEGLYTMDALGNTVLGQAQSVNVSDDGKIYTYNLRKNLSWSNGDPVTAHDFVTTVRRLASDDLTPGPKPTFLLSSLVNAASVLDGTLEPTDLGVRAIDDLTLEFRLDQPQPLFPEILSNSALAPTPSLVFAMHGANWVNQRPEVSNGAYVLTEFKDSSGESSGHLVLKRNPLYREAETTHFDRVVMRTWDKESVLAGFASGETDIVAHYKGTRGDFVEQVTGAKLIDTGLSATVYLTFNLSDNVVGDVRVRRALGLALDSDSLSLRVNPNSVPAKSFAPPNEHAYWRPGNGEQQLDSIEQRRKTAKLLLQQVGYTDENPLEVELSASDTRSSRRLVAGVASHWRAIGVQVTENYSPSSGYYPKLRDRRYQVARAGWINDVPDPSDFLLLFSKGHYNYPGWENKEFNELAQRLRVESDKIMRSEIFKRMEELIAEDLPILPLYHSQNTMIVRDSLEHGPHSPIFEMLLGHVRPRDDG